VRDWLSLIVLRHGFGSVRCFPVRILTNNCHRCGGARAPLHAVSPDGTDVYSASNDHDVRVWSINKGGGSSEFMNLPHEGLERHSTNLVRTLAGHTASVSAVVVGLSGKEVYTASDDGDILVWSTRDGFPLRTLVGHPDGVDSLVLGPDNTLCVEPLFIGL
jgi:WD40 repeat protein